MTEGIDNSKRTVSYNACSLVTSDSTQERSKILKPERRVLINAVTMEACSVRKRACNNEMGFSNLGRQTVAESRYSEQVRPVPAGSDTLCMTRRMEVRKEA